MGDDEDDDVDVIVGLMSLICVKSTFFFLKLSLFSFGSLMKILLLAMINKGKDPSHLFKNGQDDQRWFSDSQLGNSYNLLSKHNLK